MKRTQESLLLLVLICCMVVGSRVTAGGQSLSSLQDEEAIKKVIIGTTDAFNKHDAKAFARYYTTDAELVTIRGERMKGAAAIEKGLAAIFATRARTATLKMLDVSIRFIKPDVAIAHVTNEMSGVISPAGESLPQHRELSIRVFVKDDGTWRVAAFHNTMIGSP